MLAILAVCAILADVHMFMVIGTGQNAIDECEEHKGVSMSEYRDLTLQAFSAKHWMDEVHFQGRLPGSFGFEMIDRERADGEEAAMTTIVISETAAACQNARRRFHEVRDAIHLTRTGNLKPQARGKNAHGRVIFDIVCRQRQTSRGEESHCDSRSLCKTLRISSTSPVMVDVTVPCNSAQIMAQ